MFWKRFSFGGTLLLVGALALATSNAAQAQHRGGGHGGGFHAGGFRAGGFNGHTGGGFHNGAHYGGYRYHYPHTGTWGHHYYPHQNYWGHYPYYRWYGAYPYAYPYYGWYGSYPYYYDSGYYSSYGYLAPSNSEGSSIVVSPSATSQVGASASITVRLPANAILWFDDSVTKSTGTVREFVSPPLDPGQHTYTLRARWTDNGRNVEQTQSITVSPGSHMTVDFPSRFGSN